MDNQSSSDAHAVRLAQLETKISYLESDVKELSKEVLVLKVRAAYKNNMWTWFGRNWWTLLVAAGLLLEAWFVKL